uniref:Phage protein n=1 Tax=viral metagenome TaxID=1070528 RepID=A0A6H1ZAJ7_9ZZZZ
MKYNDLYRHRVFREWWENKLKSRDNIIDLRTGESMSIEERMKLIRPKVDDVAEFISDYEVEIKIYKPIGEKSWMCRISRTSDMPINIHRSDSTPTRVLILAVSEFLKRDELEVA